jgi:hypothetical protein
MIPDSGIMEGKSVVSSTQPKVPINGPYVIVGPDMGTCIVVRVSYVGSYDKYYSKQ